jgi:drug/metabolite transporter (DMT)-like permease
MVMFPVLALLLSIWFEGLEVETTTVIGTLFVLAGNVFVLKTRMPASKQVSYDRGPEEREKSRLTFPKRQIAST